MLSHEEMQRIFDGGPQVKNATLAMVNGRIYKNERDGWRLLDNRSYRTVKEMTDADGS